MIEPKPEFWATVIRWIDGDTVEMLVDLWFHVFIRPRLRVLGLDTPEKGQINYEEARSMAEYLAPVGTKLAIRSQKPDSFGRWLADIQLPDGRMYTLVMIDAGLGTPYTK